MNKTLTIGVLPAGIYSQRPQPLAIHIEYMHRRLSIHGEIGNITGGQIRDTLRDLHKDIAYAEGWDKDKLFALLDVWDRWHLNDMRAGSPRQEAFLRGKGLNHDQAAEALKEVGLNPDPVYFVDGYPCRYGHHWHHEAVPADVLTYLENLE